MKRLCALILALAVGAMPAVARVHRGKSGLHGPASVRRGHTKAYKPAKPHRSPLVRFEAQPVLGPSLAGLACAGAPEDSAAPIEDDYWLGMFMPTRFEPQPEPVVVRLNGERAFRNTGAITLTDPETGELLGTWGLVTGGGCRGSAPHGEYILGEFIDRDDSVGPRWLVRQHGWPDGQAWDPIIKDKRWDLELHRDLGGATYGCFGVQGDWPRFVAALNRLHAALGRVVFVVR